MTRFKVGVTPEFKKSVHKLFGRGWATIARFLKDVWITVRDFPDNLGTSLSWFGFMWHDRDWDYTYFYKVMRKKLKTMEKTLKTGLHCSRHSTSRMLRLALSYLDYMIGDSEPYINLDVLFRKKYGELKLDTTPDPENPQLHFMNFSFTKCPKEKTDWAESVWCRIQEKKDLATAKYKRKFFYILEKYTPYWWN